MNNLLKQILIIFSSFLLFYWIQSIDDKYYKINRDTTYQKYKNPILVASIIGLLLNINTDFNINLNNPKLVSGTDDNNNNNNNNNNIVQKVHFNREDFVSFPPPFP